MKLAKKTGVVLCLLALFVVACGPVTPVSPISTNTLGSFLLPPATITPIPIHTSAPRGTPVPSPTSSLPLLWEYSSPSLDPSAYKLKPWTDADFAFFINSLNSTELFNSYPTHLPVSESFFGYEFLLRTNQVDSESDLVWTLAQMSPRGVPLPGMRRGEDYFNFLIEELFNNSKVSFANLHTVLKSRGFGVTNTLLVRDFYGKDEDAFFFDALDENGYRNIAAVFAVRFVNGVYQVHTIKDWNWMFGLGTGREYAFKDVVDTNRNGLSELIIEEYEGHSGTPPSSQITISLNEWDNQNEAYRINTFTVFSGRQCMDDACDGNWRVETTDSKRIPSLVIQEKYSTQVECPDLTFQRTYHWNGKEYSLEEEAILPVQASESVECKVAWAESAIKSLKNGWQNDQAIQIISDALKAWPESMDIDWGPSSRDYFRLRLGVWKDFRGEGQEAVKLLEPLATKQFPTVYSLASETAAAYLEKRNSGDVVTGCQRANEVWRSVIEQEISNPYSYEMTERAREFLGFASDRWKYSANYFSSICSEDDAILAASRNLMQNESRYPAKWFTDFGRSVYLAKQADFDNDGMQDWLIIAQSSKDWPFSAEWFFFGKSNGFDPYKLDAIFDGSPSNSWRVIYPDKENNPIYLIQSEEALWVFRVNQDKQIKTLVDDFGVRLIQIDQSVGIKIKVSATDWDYQGEKVKNYVWDVPSESFVTVTEEYDFENTLQKVEQLIFQERDYLSAISLIQHFLAEAPTEYLRLDYCIENQCEYHPEIYYPGIYYLMGVAYEMSDQPEQAARTYYVLWHDYPESPYAILAQHRLEPIDP